MRLYRFPETGKTFIKEKSGRKGEEGDDIIPGDGAAVSDRREGKGGLQEIVGYEYYNGSGFLVFGNEERVNVDQLSGETHPKLY